MMRRGIGRGGRPGMLGLAARTAVIAGTATAVSGSVSRHQQAKAVQKSEAGAYEQAQLQQQQSVAAAPVASNGPSDDDIAKLEKLGKLHAQGILTDEEFTSQKAQILGL